MDRGGPKKGAPTEETLQNLTLLRGRSARLERLLESLLDYSRVGRKAGAVEAVDTRSLVSDIGEYLALAPKFSLECSPEMPVVRSPRAPLEQVFRNLISNARSHHDRPTGKIVVGGRITEDGVAEFSVEDDGPGIPGQYHEKIFEMFQTLKPRDEVEGSGMGLAIVRKTVENIGGRISVVSDPEKSRGSRFLFTWPLNA